MTMTPRIAARVAYGRSIRDRATCLIEAHGSGAADAVARAAARAPGTPAAERHFWEAVAARILRLSRRPGPPPPGIDRGEAL